MAARKDSGGTNPYGALAREQVEMQDGYKDSLENRATSVVASSATLATLLFGAATFVGSTRLSTGASLLLIAALALFCAAAGLAIWATRPAGDYRRPKAEDITRIVREDWTDDRDEAEKRVAVMYASLLSAAMTANTTKAHRLMGAVSMEALAIGVLAITASVMLLGG